MTAVHGFYLRTETLINHGMPRATCTCTIHMHMSRITHVHVHCIVLATLTGRLSPNAYHILYTPCDVSTALCPGARVDVKDKERNTSLHIAARNGHASVVKTLISYGAGMMR